MAQTTQIVPSFGFPYVDVVTNDYTLVSDTAAASAVDSSMKQIYAFASAKGPDNVWIRKSSRQSAVNTYGDSNFKKYGQPFMQALEVLDLPEFKNRNSGNPGTKLNLKTPVPTQANFFIHPGVDPNQIMLVDPRFAMIKLNAQSLMLESERIVSNQTEATYASLTTGFSKMFQDAAILLDGSKEFSTYGFPDYLNVDKYSTASLEA